MSSAYNPHHQQGYGGTGNGGNIPTAYPVAQQQYNDQQQQYNHHQQQQYNHHHHHHQQQYNNQQQQYNNNPPPYVAQHQPPYGQQQLPSSSSQYNHGGNNDHGGNIVTTYPTERYQHGSGPTNGVISEGNPVQCDKIDYEIHGSEMQLVEIVLDPNEVVIAEAGAMMFMDDDVKFEAKLGDGSNPKMGFFSSLFSAGGRLFTGESLFVTHFTNANRQGRQRRVAFAAPYPGTIIPVNMQNLNGEKLICQKDAFLCAARGTKLSIHFNKRLGSGLFGGEGFILQKLMGDGMCFIHAGGCVVKKQLNGNTIRVDTGCVVAFTSGIDFSVALVPGLKSILFGGEGLFLATLRGTGTVWLQSLPFSRFCDRVVRSAPTLGGSNTGESTLFGTQMGDVISGDGIGGLQGGQIVGQHLASAVGHMFRK